MASEVIEILRVLTTGTLLSEHTRKMSLLILSSHATIMIMVIILVVVVVVVVAITEKGYTYMHVVRNVPAAAPPGPQRLQYCLRAPDTVPCLPLPARMKGQFWTLCVEGEILHERGGGQTGELE